MQKLNLDPLTWQQHSTNVDQDGCSRGSAKEEQMNQSVLTTNIFVETCCAYTVFVWILPELASQVGFGFEKN